MHSELISNFYDFQIFMYRDVIDSLLYLTWNDYFLRILLIWRHRVLPEFYSPR